MFIRQEKSSQENFTSLSDVAAEQIPISFIYWGIDENIDRYILKLEIFTINDYVIKKSRDRQTDKVNDG